jgi:predicted transcriptional regulator
MTASALKRQFDGYLPLLSIKQQALVLEMIKAFLTDDTKTKRVTRKQYNKEINEAVDRIEKGKFVEHKNVIKKLSKW